MERERLAADAGVQAVEFLGAHLAALTRIASALCRDRADAEDLVATAVANSLGHWNRITTSRFGYMRRAMINTYLNERRKQACIQETLVAKLWEPPGRKVFDDYVGEGVADRIDIARALAVLPADQRVAVVLRFLEDLSASQVATIMGRPSGTVRRLTHQAMTTLRADGLLARPPYVPSSDIEEGQ